MKQSLWNKEIPGLFIVFLLIVGFMSASFVANNKIVNPFSHASGDTQPVAIRITNLSDNAFTISYFTTQAEEGTITYQDPSGKKNIVFDDRDNGGSQNHKIHYFSLHNLAPNTKYSFYILSGGFTYTNNGHPYTTTTTHTLSGQSSPKQTISGRVIFPSDIAPEAVAYANTKGYQSISTLVTSNGEYSLNISSMLNEQASGYIDPQSNKISLSFQASGASASLEIADGLTQNVPPIALGNSYDFSQPTPETTSNVATTSGLPLVSLSNSKVLQTKVSITSPTQGQAFSDQQPAFTGTAAPNSEITVNIPTILTNSAFVVADKYGNWQYNPSSALTPGQHKITITADDSLGISHTLSATFYIYSSGAQFLVPSVITPQPEQNLTQTPTLTPTIIITSSPTPNQKITITPTLKLTPTATPTTQLTSTPTAYPTISSTSTPTQQVVAQATATPTTQKINKTPVSGNDSALISALVALVPMILGGLLIYLSKGVIR